MSKKARRTIRKASRKVSKKARKASRKASRKVSKKARKASRKASRKVSKKARKASRKASRKVSKLPRSKRDQLALLTKAKLLKLSKSNRIEQTKSDSKYAIISQIMRNMDAKQIRNAVLKNL